MDNQRPSQGSHREPQNKADLQKEYRERERSAFRNLLGAMNEVEPTDAWTRRDILRRAAEYLRRLGQEQVDLQQQLGVLPNNTAGVGMPQQEAIILSDEDIQLMQFFLTQMEHPDERSAGAGGAYGGGA